MNRIITFLLYTLPVIIFCSYYPNFPIGSSDSTNFELSLPIIWLVLFFAATIIYLPRAVKYYKWRKALLIAALPIYAALSIIWSPNHLRAFLAAGLLALTFYAAAMIIYLLRSQDSPLQPVKDLTHNLIKTFLIATTIICAICWLQCLLDIAGLSRDLTALCLGCTHQMFGFPHPSGLAIEPQFMGNLLLAPTILTLYLAIKSRVDHQKSRRLTLLALFFTATLFLTFSRGAIYAFALALAAIIIYAVVKHFFSWRLILIPIVAFCLTLGMQGLFAELSPTSDTFLTGVTKVIHQLSLGKIDLRPAEGAPSEQSSEQPTEQSTFSGYVAESTDVRTTLTNDALSIWSSTPTNPIFGTGLGSAGTVLYEHGKTSSPKEIVQNQYASLLLELGLVGFILAAALVILVFKAFATSLGAAPVLIPLTIAYAATLFFFAGLPNALQIYLLPPLLYCCLSSQTLPSRKRDNSTPQ